MNTKEQIGANIRGLREAYGESQEDLADSVGLAGKSTIQHYEKGRREPNRDILASIAAHYQVSVEEILSCDFSSLKSIEVDEYAFYKYIDIILPVSSSEKALQNAEFRKAYEIHRSFYRQCHTFSKNTIDSLTNAFGDAFSICPVSYLEVIDGNENCIEACANYLSLVYLVMMMMKSLPTLMKSPPAAIKTIEKKNKKVKKFLDDPDPSFEAIAKGVLNDLDDEEMREFHSDLLISIKESSVWSNLADYYLALRFLWNLVDNDLDWGFNQRVGIEMLKAFASVNNPYAARFLKLGFDSISTTGTQTVVDK